MKPTLVVLAAGIGSRYGGLKQIDGLGPSGETIIDYSIYDAIRAGFGKVVFVIRKNIEEDFKHVFASKYGDKIEVDYVFQELENIPSWVKINPERQKPWGTGHAVLMAAEKIKEPFAVINGDDFYGAESFSAMAKFLIETEQDCNLAAMVGYLLKNTLSENGFVSRGVCEGNSENKLQKVTERTQIERINGDIKYKDETGNLLTLEDDTIVSMNFWGFKPQFLSHLKNQVESFIEKNSQELKAEIYIPLVVDNMIKSNDLQVEILKTTAEWFGVTYKEDRPVVIQRLQELVNNQIYPAKLW